MPDLSFPDFPDPAGQVELDEETQTVTMPLEFYARIYAYKVRVDETKAVHERQKELYENKK